MAEDRKKKSNIPLYIVLSVFGASLAFYLGFAAWLRVDGRFAFRTFLNGRDVSLRRALDVQATCMQDYYPNMSFDIESRNEPLYPITPQAFDFSDALRAVSFLPENTFLWPKSLFREARFDTSDGHAIEKLAKQIETNCPAFRSDSWQAAQNAYLFYDEDQELFRIMPDTAGTEIDLSAFESALDRHIRCGKGTLSLISAGIYRKAETQVFSPELAETQEKLNRFLNAAVEFRADGAVCSFEARKLLPYISIEPGSQDILYDAQTAVDSGIFDAFAASLAESFTALPHGEHVFTTHDGETVTVTQKTWQAKLDTDATARLLAGLSFEDYLSGTVQGRIVWLRPPLSELQNYVEVDLTAQQLYCYSDGRQILESPVVSGNLLTRHRTPEGAFTITAKRRNVILRGPGYASFVRYWIPFNRDIGLHDASWRSRFGDTIYKTNGSHGCVNLPSETAEKLYELLDDSYAVVCYWRPENTENPQNAIA